MLRLMNQSVSLAINPCAGQLFPEHSVIEWHEVHCAQIVATQFGAVVAVATAGIAVKINAAISIPIISLNFTFSSVRIVLVFATSIVTELLKINRSTG